MEYIVSMDYSPFDFIYESNCTHYIDITYEFKSLTFKYGNEIV